MGSFKKNVTKFIGTSVLVFHFASASQMGLSQDSQRSQTFVMGALGDSITRAFSSGGLLDTPRNSWSTGWSRAVTSHAQKLEEILGRTVRVSNVARSGAETDDLQRQLDKLLGQRALVDYVTLLIGANDICGWGEEYDSSLNTFHQRINSIIEQLVDHNPEIKIVLVPIPDMYHLWEIGKEQGCQLKWNLTGFCSALLGENRSDDDRLEFVGKWRAANDSLQAIAEAWGAHVAFAQEAQHLVFEPEDVSTLDCFHPSVKGQNLISEETWNSGWY